MSLTSRLSPKMEKLIDTIAEAKASLIIANAHLPPNRAAELVWLDKLCEDARAIVADLVDSGSAADRSMSGRLVVELVACEAGLDKLRKATT